MLRKPMSNAAFTAAFVGACISTPVPIKAQIGSGWTEYTPDKTLQLRGCGTHNAAGDVETFGLSCSNSSEDNRAEQRIRNDYTSGTRQFEGEVRVVTPGVNTSLKQTFMPDNGAFLMIAVAADGRLYMVGGSGNVASGVVGRWVRINTIHDVGAGTHQVYVDGILRHTKTGGRQVAWHDKYGTYRTSSGHGPAAAEWRNVRYWRDGRSSGTSVHITAPANPIPHSAVFFYQKGSTAGLPWKGNRPAARVEILDLQGMRLARGAGWSALSGLPAGTYLYRLSAPALSAAP